MRLGHLTRPHYANILLLSDSGERLSTISAHRADWYVEKNLAWELPIIEGYSRVLKLKFTPKNNLGCAFSLQVKFNECVVCGSDEELTLHHVIPYCIKRYFSPQDKEHTSEWCVLCCEECHVQAEQEARLIYGDFLDNFTRTFNNHPNLIRNQIILKLYKLKLQGGNEYVQPEKLANWLKQSEVFKSLDDIPTDYHELKKSFIDMKAWRRQLKYQLTLKFIEDNGGVQGIKTLFRTAFLKMRPQFLQKGFLEI
jgi:hypothetical protein